jgi:hypothetical protein
MEKVVAICLSAALLVGSGAQAAAAVTDMPSGWAKPALERMVKEGIMEGSNGRIYPERTLTRAEFAAMVSRGFGANRERDLSGFRDVDSGSWYAAPLARAVQMGMFQGDGVLLYPEHAVTRQEAFAALARVLELPDGDLSALEGFSDAETVAVWAIPGVAAMVSAGYVQGSQGRLLPQASMTRAEAAQLMSNLAEHILGEEGNVSGVQANGNVIIKASGVTLADTTVGGDLIIGDGVGDGDITLDGVTVQGRLIVRGGGENSVRLQNSRVAGEIVVQNRNHPVRLALLGNSSTGTIRVRSALTLDGSAGTLVLETAAPLTLGDGTVGSLVITGSGAVVSLGQGARVTSLTARGSAVVSGQGLIEQALVQADQVQILAPAARIVVDNGVTGTLAGDIPVAGGQTAAVDRNGVGRIIGGASSGGGSSSGGEPAPSGEMKTEGNWVSIEETGIVSVDFLRYAAVVLRQDAMGDADFTQYTYYINGVKQETGKDVTKVAVSADGQLVIIKILLPNNAPTQLLRLVRGSEYMEIQLAGVGASVKK